MTETGFFQIILYLIIILLLVKPLGGYIARVYEGKRCGLDIVMRPAEHLIYRVCGIHFHHEMGWKNYLSSLLFFNLLSILFVYVILRLQEYLPLNPQHFAGVAPDLAFNTAISFATNTNWQAYAGENTLSYFSQMFALTTQNFVSAASGMCVLMALIRSLVRHETSSLGNFWVDLVRGILYIFLPLSLLLGIILSSQGVIQNFKAYEKIHLTKTFSANNQTISEQIIPMGPVASQVAIKQLGSNGGGFFNTNSAHPFENPNVLSNFLEMFAILLIPAALCYTFGVMVKDRRQGWVILMAMLFVFVPLLFATVIAESYGNPVFNTLGIDQTAQASIFPGGNMEGKETRFGIVNSAMWAASTTATSNGSVNAMLDSFTPLGGFVLLWFIHLGEVIFGGVGSGLYSMLMVVIISVFIAGLTVGRTPEYLGKKIEPFEMKMASLVVLVIPMVVLIFTAIAAVIPAGTSSILNPGAHGLTEILYAFASMTNNNGSAFAGLSSNTYFYNILGGITMLIGRYWFIIPTLALAGSLVRKKTLPSGAATLPTHTMFFVFFLIGVTLIFIGALTFFPVLALGPIVEHLMLWGHYAG